MLGGVAMRSSLVVLVAAGTLVVGRPAAAGDVHVSLGFPVVVPAAPCYTPPVYYVPPRVVPYGYAPSYGPGYGFYQGGYRYPVRGHYGRGFGHRGYRSRGYGHHRRGHYRGAQYGGVGYGPHPGIRGYTLR